MSAKKPLSVLANPDAGAIIEQQREHAVELIGHYLTFVGKSSRDERFAYTQDVLGLLDTYGYEKFSKYILNDIEKARAMNIEVEHFVQSTDMPYDSDINFERLQRTLKYNILDFCYDPDNTAEGTDVCDPEANFEKAKSIVVETNAKITEISDRVSEVLTDLRRETVNNAVMLSVYSTGLDDRKHVLDYYETLLTDSPEKLKGVFFGIKTNGVGPRVKMRPIRPPEVDEANLLLAQAPKKPKVRPSAPRAPAAKRPTKRVAPKSDRKPRAPAPKPAQLKGPTDEDRIAVLQDLSGRASNKIAALTSAIDEKDRVAPNLEAKLIELKEACDGDIELFENVIQTTIEPLIEKFGKAAETLSPKHKGLLEAQEINTGELRVTLSPPRRSLSSWSAEDKTSFLQDDIVEELSKAIEMAATLDEGLAKELEDQRNRIVALGQDLSEKTNNHSEMSQHIAELESWQEDLTAFSAEIDTRDAQLKLAIDIANMPAAEIR